MINLRSGILGLTLTSALVLAATSANAADIYNRAPAVGGYKDGPVYAVNSWTGFYIGANGGYAWDANSSDVTDPETGFNSGNFSREGGFGGGQIGYNFGGAGIFGPQFVFGIEADIQGADINDSITLNGLGDRFSSRVDYFGTVRGRIGYSFDRTLVYATGGFAYGNVKDTYSTVPVGRIPGGVASNEDTQTGYVVGGGIETKISPNWSVKAEYQYINLDKGNDLFEPNSGNTFVTKDTELHTARVGLNYHFNTPYESLK